MVKIAIAGGSGNVAQEIIDVLVSVKKHDIVILSRKDVPGGNLTRDVTWAKVNYEDVEQLIEVLRGVHTVLSFVTDQEDPTSPVQRNLIDAAIQAGVHRFAPSEWASSGLEHLSWYAYKAETRRYLKEVNRDKKVLEYTLFQPGLFVNYLTRPYQSSKHIHQMETPFDFENRRAILRSGGNNDYITLTTVQDLANVVARAVDYEGEWPVIGGIRGTNITIERLMSLGEELRGSPFNIERLNGDDLATGQWKTSWIPKLDHPSLPKEQVDMFSRIIVAGLLLAISDKAFEISDEWNKLLPDYKFTQADEFLTEVWGGKP